MATIGGKAIATTRSNHFCPGPLPATSLAPPTPPAGPVPAPFVYVARSSSASGTKEQLRVGGAPVLVNGSAMSVEMPGNAPCQSTGGDIVTHLVNASCGVFTGSSKVFAGGQPVACTGDSTRMNVPSSRSTVAQTTGMLMMAATVRMGSIEGGAVNMMVVLDPVSVATGDVVDENVDLAIDGLIPIGWKRLYSTARAREHTPLGRGGWTHAYHQWVAIDGDRLSLRDADGSTVSMPVSAPGERAFHRGRRITVTRDARGGVKVFALDTRLTRTFEPLGGGRAFLRAIEDASGRRISLEYEAERLVRIVDVAGRTIAFTHDGAGHIVRLDVFAAGDRRRASVHTVTFAYDEAGELIAVTDPLGHTESYAYDAERRLARKTLPTGLSFHYRYDPETGRCVRSWGDGGLHAGDLEYDLDQGITRLTGALEPQMFAWREDGSVVRRASPDGNTARNLTYDEDGLLIEETDAAGDTFRLTRDARGNVTRIEGPGGSIVELDYLDDQVVRRRIDGLLTEYGRDACGRLVSVRYPSGASLLLSYDALGRLVAVHGPDGLRGSFVYDERHQVVEEHTPRGGVRRWRYDALGRPVSFTNPLGHVTRRELDALGRPLALHLPDGSSTRFAHDALGRLVRRVDPLGREEQFRYAGLESLVELVAPDGALWSFTYDLGERLQQIRNPRGEAFDFRYDRAGNLREMRSFDGRVARAQHGKNGRVARVELPDGAFRALRYEAAGELAAEETPHGSAKVTRREHQVEFHLEDPTGDVRVIFERDDLGRVIAETQNGRTIRYEYDIQNRVVVRRLPTGSVTRYSYDEEGLVSALDHDGYRVEIQRDLAGSVLRMVFAGCGVEARRAVDPMARPVREWVGAGERALVDRVYRYDATGALVERNDLRAGPTRYGYDTVGMLVEARSPKGVEAFEYDAGGAIRPRGAEWQTGPGGLLLRAGAVSYSYDRASRRTREVRADGTEIEYLWDCRGQLREVRGSDGSQVLFAYDSFGRRVRKTIVPPVAPPSSPEALPAGPPKHRVVEYLWSGSCLVAELDSERGARVHVYEPTTMRPLLQQEGGVIYAVITDPLGIPTELLTPAGEIAWAARHSAWGIVTDVFRAPGTSVSSPFRLLGHYHDEETDLFYARYRYFDPATARFLSPDPLEVLGGKNLFAFNGSPTTSVDPLGLSCLFIGNPAADLAIAQTIAAIKPNPNALTVVVHGTPNTIDTMDGAGNWTSHTGNHLTAAIARSGAYNGESAIVLNSCNTGRYDGGIAQQVSAAYPGARVWAPNDTVWGLGLHVGPAKGVSDSTIHAPPPGEVAVPDPARPGAWNAWSGGRPEVYTPPVAPLPPPVAAPVVGSVGPGGTLPPA